MDPFLSLFAYLESLAPLPESEKERFRPMLRSKQFSKGEYFIRAGERSGFIGFMNVGLLRYFYVDEEGREFTRYFCQTGHFVSSSDSTGTARYSIQALEDTEMILFREADWQGLLDTHPVWGKITVAVQEYALRLAEERERSLIMDDAATRYEKLLHDFPGIENKVKQYDIAGYLGITPVSLSRIRGKSGV